MSGSPPRSPGSPKRGRPAQKGLATLRRAQIVDSAREVFTENGYERTTMADLAARAGLGQGTVYRYFAGKRDILDAVFDRCVDDLVEAADLGRFAAGIDGPDDLVRVGTAVGTDVLDLIRRSPYLITLVLVDGAAVDEELAARVRGLQAMVSAALASVLESGRRDGWIRPAVDPAAYATMLLSMTLPALLRSLTGVDPSGDARYAGRLVDLAVRGLVSP